jgi:hypothetical protein
VIRRSRYERLPRCTRALRSRTYNRSAAKLASVPTLQICLINNLTVVVAWTCVTLSGRRWSRPAAEHLSPNSPEEAGQYIATYKLYEHKSPDILKERVAQGYENQLHRLLTTVKGVNKTDVLTLSTSFGVRQEPLIWSRAKADPAHRSAARASTGW